MKKYTQILIVVLFEIGFGLNFNIVGRISLSELFLLGYSIFYLPKMPIGNFKALKAITFLYIGLLLAQIISELVIGNLISNSLKGVAVTVVSYLHVTFLLSYFMKRKELIVYAIVGMLLRQLIFDNIQFSKIVDPIYLKFVLAIFIINTLIVFSVLFKIKKNIISLAFVFIGGMFLILGGRSIGLMSAMVGILPYVIQGRGNLNLRKLITTAFVAIICIYPLYIYYVNKVLSGDWGMEANRTQLLRTENPYSPIQLLRSGRAEAFVGWQAFMDEPLTGHGTWALDKTLKYHRMLAEIQGRRLVPDKDKQYLLPSHSVIIGYAALNGLAAFICVLMIILYILYLGFMSIDKKDVYLSTLLFFMMWLFWNSMFSPITHFRLTLPISMALILALYFHKTSKLSLKVAT